MKDSAARQAEPDLGRRPFGRAPQNEPWNQGAWLLRDRTLKALEILLDEAFRVPGTPIRFGLDGILGLLPGVGDVIAGLLSAIIPLAAWLRGIPYVTLARMVVNISVGVLLGSIPLFGDIFDIGWKTNRRNYRLLQAHVREPRRHAWSDWIFLFLCATALALVFVIPIVLLIWLVRWLLHR